MRGFVAGVAVGALAGAFAAWLLALRRRRRPPALEQGAMPSESTIRLMTRLAIEHSAVNLSQGFPNEPPPLEMAVHAAGALLDGSSSEAACEMAQRLKPLVTPQPPTDFLNQYSFPAGLPSLRAQISAYYGEFYPSIPADAEENITVTNGATEGFAVCLRALCRPGDVVAFFEPFHELYPSQCAIWGFEPRAITLREGADGSWAYDPQQLREVLRESRALLFNSPHNPTGHVFGEQALGEIAELCIAHGVLAVTDEIYEHMCFGGARHVSLATIKGMADRTCVVSAVSKSARATGWRVGWVISPSAYTPAIRACHDQLVVQAATPMQFGAQACLALGRPFFESIADEYAEKRDLLVGALRRAGFDVRASPHGAYYLFAGYDSVPALKSLSPREAAMAMITRHGVACVPGDNFYLGASRTDPALGGRYLRFTFVRSLAVLREAAVRLERMADAPPSVAL